MQTSQFQVEGLSCQACQKIIQKRVGKIQGVTEVSVDLNGKLELKSDRTIDKAELINVLKDTDYKVK